MSRIRKIVRLFALNFELKFFMSEYASYVESPFCTFAKLELFEELSISSNII